MYVRLKRFRRKSHLWVVGEDGRYEYEVDAAGHQRHKLVDGTLLVAQLVESRRVDGASRQRVVRHLGSVRDGGGPAARGRFWAAVDRHLDEFGIAGGERARAEHRLSEVIPRPTDAERAAELRAWADSELRTAGIVSRVGGDVEGSLANDKTYVAEADRLDPAPDVVPTGEHDAN